MKNTLAFLFALAILATTYAQVGYRLYHEENGMEIYGKWKHEKWFGRGPYILCVKIKNTTDKQVQANFSVQYYDGALLEEEFEVGPVCLGPGKKMAGRKNNLCFVSQKFEHEQFFDEAFHWRVDDLKISEDCEMAVP